MLQDQLFKGLFKRKVQHEFFVTYKIIKQELYKCAVAKSTAHLTLWQTVTSGGDTERMNRLSVTLLCRELNVEQTADTDGCKTN